MRQPDIFLPDNIDRCSGSGGEKDGWREGCENCLRRTAPSNRNHVSYMEPPAIIAFWCEFLIEI